MESSLHASSSHFRLSRQGDDWWSPLSLLALHSSDPPDQEMIGGVLPACLPDLHSSDPPEQEMIGGALPACQLSTQALQTRR
jgi:hypothetical protein